MSNTVVEIETRPAKFRRTGFTSTHPIYGPMREEDTVMKNWVSLDTTNVNKHPFVGMKSVSSISAIPLDQRDKNIPSHQAQAIAELTDVAGDLKNVRFLRNNLPELASYAEVVFDVVYNFWVVDLGTSTLPQPLNLPLFIGRCPVYVHDDRAVAGFKELNNMQKYELKVKVDPRHIVDDAACDVIKTAFPRSVGMRVHTYGFVEILYADQNQIRQEMRHGHLFPETVGGIHYVLTVVKVRFTARNKNFASPKEVVWNAPVAKSTQLVENLQATGCVGLRIRRSGDAEDRWTTVTHAWMTRPPTSITKLGKAIRSATANVLTFVKRANSPLGSSQHEEADFPQVIGTKVYIAGQKTKVGTITKCYDALPLPESTLVWPMGVDHDLCLIEADEGETLPTMADFPNVARPRASFATPNEIIDAEVPTAFHAYNNFNLGKRVTKVGTVVVREARMALIAGADYFWEKRYLTTKRSVIWRTFVDDDSLAGGSGGVICLGNPAATFCTAAVFQNYQSYTFATNKFWENDWRTKRGWIPRCCYKGGFLLPEDIQSATIITPGITSAAEADDPEGHHSVSGPASTVARKADAPVHDRRKDMKTD